VAGLGRSLPDLIPAALDPRAAPSGRVAQSEPVIPMML